MEMSNDLSHDILNLIFSYIQSNTNKIMKEHINDVKPYYLKNCENALYPHKRENHLKIMMQMSNAYGIKHFNIDKFNYEFYKCDYCYKSVSSKILEHRGLYLCSEYCLENIDYM